MGIIRAAVSAADAVLKEQWREFFACDALDAETLVVRGEKRVGERSANTRADDNVISNGSQLLIADGQCVLVVSQGKVIDVCDEPGAHTFVDPARPGGVGGFFRDVKNRVGFGGGDVQPIRHRIYYVNTKESGGIRFDTPAPVALSVRDEAIGADLTLGVQAGGVYAYRVKDSVNLYRAVVGNISGRFLRSALNTTVTAMLLSALPEALHAVVGDGVRPHALALHTNAIAAALTAQTKDALLARYGLELVSIAFDKLIVADRKLLQSAQQAAVNRDPKMAAATMTDAYAAAIRNLKKD